MVSLDLLINAIVAGILLTLGPVLAAWITGGLVDPWRAAELPGYHHQSALEQAALLQ